MILNFIKTSGPVGIKDIEANQDFCQGTIQTYLTELLKESKIQRTGNHRHFIYTVI